MISNYDKAPGWNGTVDNFSDIPRYAEYKASSSFGCIAAYSDWVRARVDDIVKFVTEDSSDEGTNMSISLPFELDDSHIELLQLSKNDYVNWNGEDDQVVALTLKNGTTVEKQMVEVNRALEQYTIDLKTQSVFLDYTTSADSSVNATDFLTRLSNLVGTIDTSVVSNYINIFNNCNTPLDAIKAFFKLSSSIRVNDYDETIELVDGSLYGGSVWISALTQVVDTIEGFFDITWKGISKIGQFFKDVLGGIIQFGKWLITTAFGYLKSDFEQVGDRSYGILDFPLVQVNYGRVSLKDIGGRSVPICTGFESMLQKWEQTYYYLPSSNKIFNFTEFGDNIIAGINKDDVIPLNEKLAIKLASLVYKEVNGKFVKRITEVIVPNIKGYNNSDPSRILIDEAVLRFGLNENNQLICLIYPVLNKDFFDIDEIDKIKCLKIWANVVLGNIAYATPYQSWNVTNYNTIVDAGFTPTESTTLYDLVKGQMFSFEPLNYLNEQGFILPEGQNQPIPVDWYSRFEFSIGMCLYGIMYGSDWITDYLSDNLEATKSIIQSFCELITEPQGMPELGLSHVTNTTFDFNNWGEKNFRPYSHISMVPIAVHYQTTSERAEEIIKAILTTIVAAAAVYATVKIAKWRRNRRYQGELLQSRAESLSWQVNDPNSGVTVNDYIRARKKAKRFNKINSALGITSGYDSLYNSLLPAIEQGANSNLFSSDQLQQQNNQVINGIKDISSLIS